MSNIYSEVLDVINQGKTIGIKTVISGEEGEVSSLQRSLVPVEPVMDAKGRRSVRVTAEKAGDTISVLEPVQPLERMIILGGGHVSLAVYDFAIKCGFRVYVVDDRPAFANEMRFPEAAGVICDTFENAIQKLKITAFDFVIIVTRGHTHDGDCLRAILPGERPAYLGMIGSRRRVRGLLDMLKEEGYDKEFIDSICSPIGLHIGGVTPHEIAVSILAEVISYKRLPEHSRGDFCVNDSDLESDMISFLAKNTEPKAIMTIIEAKGSTPRGCGAKVSINKKGQTTGSIGGGCSEGAVLRDAIDIIGTGRYKIIGVDMTGEVAESEGMVCGGTMKVLVEDGTQA